MSIESYNSTYNQDFVNQNSLYVRLNTQPIIEDIELFLMGMKWLITKNETGQDIIAQVPICDGSKPRANPLGIQSILSFLRCQLNAQVVQGNFTGPELQHFIYEVHTGLITDIMVNMYRWGISEEDYEFLINTIMNMLQAFFSRTKDNEERKSFTTTLRYTETSNPQGENKNNLGGRT